MTYPPKDHPAWFAFCDETGFPRIPHVAGEYWYDNCWGTCNEEREPCRIQIQHHDEGMQIVAINGQPEKTDRAIVAYTGRWAPLDWEQCVPNSVEMVQADTASSYVVC